MSYETWEATNVVAILAALIAPVVLAVAVFLNRRQSRDAEGKRNGRAVLWSFVTAFFSLLAFVMAWGLILREPFSKYSARWDEEHSSDDQTATERQADADVIDGVVGQWRPNNRNRTDYFAFTAETYSSINPEFDTTITYGYEVIRRDGPCMRIQSTNVLIIQSGQVTRDEPARGDPFFVCVDPESDVMLMRFDSDRGDVFFVRID